MFKKLPYEAIILGIKVCITNQDRVLNLIREKAQAKANPKLFWVVTAYSETLLTAGEMPKFAQTISKADLIVADGVSIAAAADYLNRKTGKWWENLRLGGEIGRKIFMGEYSNRVTGVELVKEILFSQEPAGKVFLLGGYNGVAGRLAEKVKKANPELRVEWEEGPKDISYQLSGNNYQLAGNSNQSSEIIEKINRFEPDVLLVAFGRYNQEIWIAENLTNLKSRVVIGVGSTFDELTGEGVWKVKVPEWVNRRGLKWLWRAVHDPKHWPRVFRAAVVFPWRVYRS